MTTTERRVLSAVIIGSDSLAETLPPAVWRETCADLVSRGLLAGDEREVRMSPAGKDALYAEWDRLNAEALGL